jgi:hypothetical protein
MTLGSTQSLTEMSTRSLSESKGRPGRKPDNLTAIYKLIVQKMWEHQCLTAYGLPRHVTKIALFFTQTFYGLLANTGQRR